MEGRENQPGFYPRVEEKDGYLLNNLNINNITSSGGINIQTGFAGQSFYIPYSENQYHNKYYKINYIESALYKTGIPLNKTGLYLTESGLFSHFSGIVNGNILTNIPNSISNVSFNSYFRYNNANINCKIYEINSGINNSVEFFGKEIYNNYFLITNFSGSNTGAVYKFNINSDYIFEINKKYILFLSGQSSGYVSGKLSSGLFTANSPKKDIEYVENVYLSNNGNSNYLSDFNINFETGIYGKITGSNIFLEKNNLNFNIYGNEIYDFSEITGIINIAQETEYQLITMSIYKKISIENNDFFDGDSSLFISGKNINVTGKFFIQKNRFRLFEPLYNI